MINLLSMRAAFLITLVFGHFAYAMPPASFLSDMGRQSESLKQARELRRKASANYELSDNLWSTSLGVEAGYLDSEIETTLSTQPTVQTGIQSQANVTQSTSLGLTAAFTATFFEDDDRDASESFSIGLEQKLWRNSFGSADRAALKAAEKIKLAGLLEADLKAYSACDEAYALYFSTWRAQENLRILKDVLKLAEKSFKITRRNYRRKLVRKLDFESANVDFLGVQDRVLAAQNEWLRESENYKRYSKLSQELIYSFQPVELLNPPRLLLADVSKLKFESQELLKDKERSESRSDVSLFADVDLSEAPSSLTSDLGTTDTKTYLVGLRFDFPWLDKGPQAQYKAALANAASAKQAWRKQEGDQRVRLEYLVKLLDETKQKLTRQQERLKMRASQVKQANRYLNTGKMEFDDYLRYRNGELEERLRGMDLVKAYWDTRLDIMQSTGDGAEKLCGEFIGEET